MQVDSDSVNTSDRRTDSIVTVVWQAPATSNNKGTNTVSGSALEVYILPEHSTKACYILPRARSTVHKYTWECRGRGLRTIIYYFAERKALRQTVADVKVIRGAEAGSNHYLVLMKVNLRWTRRKKKVRNEGTRLRLRKLLDLGEQVRFQTELGKLFE